MGTAAGWWKWESGLVRKILIVTGLIFLGLTVVITLKPEPFLKFGLPGVFVFNMLSGPGMFLLPTLSTKMNVVALAFFSALGMAINDSVSWMVGTNGEEVLPANKKIEKIRQGIQKYGPWALLAWSLIPFPYDLIGLVAGYLKIPYLRYLIPTFAGKFLRFLAIASGAAAMFS